MDTHPLSRQGHPRQAGGAGVTTQGQGAKGREHPTTNHPSPVTKPQHASVCHHLHIATETRIIRT